MKNVARQVVFNSKAIIGAIVSLLLVGVGVGIFFALPGESQEETETSPTHALAIWDRYGQHASTLMVMQMNGNARNTWNKGMTQPLIDYYTGVSTKGSCSLVYQNKFYFFGYWFRIVWCFLLRV